MLRDWRWETVFHPTYTILDMSLWSCQCRSIWMVPKGKSKIFWQWLIQANMNCLNYNNWIRSKSPLCWCVNTSWVFESGIVAGGNTCVLTQTSFGLYFIVVHQCPSWGCPRCISNYFSPFTTQHSPQPHNTQWIKLTWIVGTKPSKENEGCEAALSPFRAVSSECQSTVL